MSWDTIRSRLKSDLPYGGLKTLKKQRVKGSLSFLGWRRRMSELCINCGVLLGPVFVSLALIMWGISSKLINWSDLKDRKVIVPEIGIVLLALSFVWMFIQIFKYEKMNYLLLFFPAFIGLGVTSVGVFRLRHDVNFSGAEYAYAGIVLFFGSLLWVYWVLQAFS